MTNENRTRSLKLAIVVLGIALVAGLASVGWWWKDKQAMDDLVSPGLILINYTDHDVYASVRYSKFPNPGEGARSEAGPHSGGGGLDCCVPIPTKWRPGIKMIVWYSSVNHQEGTGQTKIIELPEYPDGRPGALFLVFHKDAELELFSSMFGPRHPRWPGHRIEPVLEGAE